jgi:hypothetical protein
LSIGIKSAWLWYNIDMRKISHIKKDNKTINDNIDTKSHTLLDIKDTKKVGRPAINLTDYEDEIYDLLSIGSTISQVLNFIGIDDNTYYRQLEKNKRLRDKFARAKEFTSVKAKRNISEKIQQGDVETSKWHLEKTEYKNKESTAFASDEGGIKFVITRE